MSKEDDDVILSNMSMHQAMRQQMFAILDDADLTEEQKQEILIAMSCSCCGGSGLSLTVPLKGSRPGF